jgi:hypothetical protein
MHRSRREHFLRVVTGGGEKTAKVSLSLKAGFTPLRFFSSTTFSSTAHFITSVEDCQQISRDVIDCSVTINPVKQALLFVPSSEWRGLLVIGRQAVHHGPSVVIRTTLLLVIATRATFGGNWIEHVVEDGSTTAACGTAADAFHDSLIRHLD